MIINDNIFPVYSLLKVLLVLWIHMILISEQDLSVCCWIPVDLILIMDHLVGNWTHL